MDKLSYELNKVAEKSVKKTVIMTIKMLKKLNFSYNDVLKNLLQNFGNDMPKTEIERLVKENY